MKVSQQAEKFLNIRQTKQSYTKMHLLVKAQSGPSINNLMLVIHQSKLSIQIARTQFDISWEFECVPSYTIHWSYLMTKIFAILDRFTRRMWLDSRFVFIA